MAWTLEFTKHALKDAVKLKRAGMWKKAEELLGVLEENPFKNPPPFERLIGDLHGIFSRRINIQHRLTYTVDEETRTVRVSRMWTHYE